MLVSRILERGDIFFFYRPRVNAARAYDFEDVQRFFFVLRPDGKRLFREIIVGRKRLPDPDSHEREWAFVAEVSPRASELEDELEADVYDTKTRGLRVEPEARPRGRGTLRARRPRRSHPSRGRAGVAASPRRRAEDLLHRAGDATYLPSRTLMRPPPRVRGFSPGARRTIRQSSAKCSEIRVSPLRARRSCSTTKELSWCS